jgi:hypothetical protein
LLQTVPFEIAAVTKEGFAQHWPHSSTHTDPQFACGLHDFVCIFRYTELFRQQAEVTSRRVCVTIVAVGKEIIITRSYLFTNERTS